MNKANVKVDQLKKVIARLVKAAPAKKGDAPDPLARLIRAFLEYDCDEARAEVAEKKFQTNMVDNNELRVTPAIELAAILGVRYPFAESRCAALHRTLQSIFDREHHMNLNRLKEMKKTEIRPYLLGLAGITPYVEAAVALECFDVAAVPMDTKFLLWLISKDVLPADMDIRSAQAVVEKHIKVSEAAAFFHGARKEIDAWSPRVWPPVAKVGSPVLAPVDEPRFGTPSEPPRSDVRPAPAAPAAVKAPAKPGKPEAQPAKPEADKKAAAKPVKVAAAAGKKK